MLIKEVKMRVRNIITRVGILVILGGGVIFAGDTAQVRDRNQLRVEVKPLSKVQFQNRKMFMDENGDGICDGLRDHDNDGIPNGQDPDWSKPKDGTGNQVKNGNANRNSKNQFGNRNGSQNGNNWNKQSFRQSNPGFGSGLCDTTGSKGNGRRGGNR
jgi:hypothetical protein